MYGHKENHGWNSKKKILGFQSAVDNTLKNQVFKKLDMSRFFFDLERKFQSARRGTAVDLDLFAHAARGESNAQQLVELLHQFRRTPQTASIMESTTQVSITDVMISIT